MRFRRTNVGSSTPLLRFSASLVALTLAACSRGDAAPAADAAPAPAASAIADAATGALTPARRSALVARMIPEIEAHYVFPEVGAQMAAALRAHAAQGDYDAITRGEDFGTLVTTHLRAVSHDRHVMLEYFATAEPGETDAERAADADRRARFGMGPIERLAGNVARVVFDSFEPAGIARRAVMASMAKVADASALILDLRENIGGDPETVALVLSYLFDGPPVHLNDLYWRDDGSTEQYWTRTDITGARFGGKKPVFVLTSKHTFSAGEELAYDLQALKRAAVIGETTAGGAHPVAPRKLDAQFTLRVPNGRAINPVTHTNWEGTGVTPDVPVDAARALETALGRAAAPRGK